MDNDPSSILHEQMLAALYLSHPYGTPVIGWEHEIQALSREDALSYYKRFYAPNNAILVVAGDVTPEEVRSLADKTYGVLKPEPDISKQSRAREPEPQAARSVFMRDARAGQATLQRFYTVPSYTTAKPGEAEALDLLMKILASGSTSRLYKTLVVEQKLAANASGWYSGTGLDSGRVGFYAVSNGGNKIEDIEKSLNEQIAKIVENGVTDAELERARNAYIADYVYANDSQSKLARRYGWALATGRTINDVDAWPKRLERVTVEQVNAVAKIYLRDDTQCHWYLST